jgi:hypothetical protein
MVPTFFSTFKHGLPAAQAGLGWSQGCTPLRSWWSKCVSAKRAPMLVRCVLQVSCSALVSWVDVRWAVHATACMLWLEGRGCLCACPPQFRALPPRPLQFQTLPVEDLPGAIAWWPAGPLCQRPVVVVVTAPLGAPFHWVKHPITRRHVVHALAALRLAHVRGVPTLRGAGLLDVCAEDQSSQLCRMAAL